MIESLFVTAGLPPLAFGPGLPPNPFAPPRALVCDIHELGRIQVAGAPRWSVAPAVDGRGLRLTREPYLVNRAVDTLLFLGVAAAGKATWADNATRFDAAWLATPVPGLPKTPVPAPTPP